jgi:hypothetical protein
MQRQAICPILRQSLITELNCDCYRFGHLVNAGLVGPVDPTCVRRHSPQAALPADCVGPLFFDSASFHPLRSLTSCSCVEASTGASWYRPRSAFQTSWGVNSCEGAVYIHDVSFIRHTGRSRHRRFARTRLRDRPRARTAGRPRHTIVARRECAGARTLVLQSHDVEASVVTADLSVGLDAERR